MDPEGRGNTQAGYICGIVGTGLGALSALACVAWVGFMVWISTASKPQPVPFQPVNPPTQKSVPPTRRIPDESNR
jgi:hypothetical protein